MGWPDGRKHTEEEKQHIREGKAHFSATRQQSVEFSTIDNGHVVTIYTAENKIPFIIDAADYDVVSYYSWTDIHGYISTKIGVRPNRRNIRLHIFLLGSAPLGLEWDHHNQNSLDNRRSNLRAVTHSINMLNRQLQINNISGFAGISQVGKKWAARIQLNGKGIWLGRFDTIEEARAVRRKAEIDAVLVGEQTPKTPEKPND